MSDFNFNVDFIIPIAQVASDLGKIDSKVAQTTAQMQQRWKEAFTKVDIGKVLDTSSLSAFNNNIKAVFSSFNKMAQEGKVPLKVLEQGFNEFSKHAAASMQSMSLPKDLKSNYLATFSQLSNETKKLLQPATKGQKITLTSNIKEMVGSWDTLANKIDTFLKQTHTIKITGLDEAGNKIDQINAKKKKFERDPSKPPLEAPPAQGSLHSPYERDPKKDPLGPPPELPDPNAKRLREKLGSPPGALGPPPPLETRSEYDARIKREKFTRDQNLAPLEAPPKLSTREHNAAVKAEKARQDLLAKDRAAAIETAAKEALAKTPEHQAKVAQEAEVQRKAEAEANNARQKRAEDQRKAAIRKDFDAQVAQAHLDYNNRLASKEGKLGVDSSGRPLREVGRSPERDLHEKLSSLRSGVGLDLGSSDNIEQILGNKLVQHDKKLASAQKNYEKAEGATLPGSATGAKPLTAAQERKAQERIDTDARIQKRKEDKADRDAAYRAGVEQRKAESQARKEAAAETKRIAREEREAKRRGGPGGGLGGGMLLPQDLLNFLAFSTLSSAVSSLASKMIAAAGDMEQFHKRLTIVTHGIGTEKLFEFAKKYEKETPFQIKEVMQATIAFATQQKTLTKLGRNTEGTVRMAGELGSINPDAGLLDAQRAISRVAAGDANGLEILRSQFGISNDILQDRGVKISAQGVSLQSITQRKAVMDAIDQFIQDTTGSKGALSQNETLQGKLSSLSSQGFQTMASIMEPLVPILMDTVLWLTEFLNQLTKMPYGIKMTIDAMVIGMAALTTAATAGTAVNWGGKVFGVGGQVAAGAVGAKLASGLGSGVVAAETEVAAKVIPGAMARIGGAFSYFGTVLAGKAAPITLGMGAIAGAVIGIGLWIYTLVDHFAYGIESMKKTAILAKKQNEASKKYLAQEITTIDIGMGNVRGVVKGKSQQMQSLEDSAYLENDQTNTYVFGSRAKRESEKNKINKMKLRAAERMAQFGGHTTEQEQAWEMAQADYDKSKHRTQDTKDLKKAQAEYESTDTGTTDEYNYKKAQADYEAAKERSGQLEGKGLTIPVQEVLNKAANDIQFKMDLGQGNHSELVQFHKQNAALQLDLARGPGNPQQKDAAWAAYVTETRSYLKELANMTSEANGFIQRTVSQLEAVGKMSSIGKSEALRTQASNIAGTSSENIAQRAQLNTAADAEDYKRLQAAIQRTIELSRYRYGEEYADLAKLKQEKIKEVQEYAETSKEKEAFLLKQLRARQDAERASYGDQGKLANLTNNLKLDAKFAAQELDVRRSVESEKQKINEKYALLEIARKQQTINTILSMDRAQIATLSQMKNAELSDNADSLQSIKNVINARFDSKPYEERRAILADTEKINKNIEKSMQAQAKSDIDILTRDNNQRIKDRKRELLDPSKGGKVWESQKVKEEAQQDLAIWEKETASKIKLRKKKYSREVDTFKQEQKNQNDEKAEKIGKDKLDAEVLTMEAAKAGLEYTASANDFLKKDKTAYINNLKEQYELEKAISLTKLKAATDPKLNPGMSPLQRMALEKQNRIELLNLDMRTIEKLKEATSETEKQNRLLEIQKELKNDKGFTLGGTYTLEEMNKRDALDSEAMRLKAGFGEEFMGQDHGFGAKQGGQQHGEAMAKDPLARAKAKFGFQDPRFNPEFNKYTSRNNMSETINGMSTTDLPGSLVSGSFKQTMPSAIQPIKGQIDVNVNIKEGSTTIGKQSKSFDPFYSPYNNIKY